jgi:hypothetical protein
MRPLILTLIVAIDLVLPHRASSRDQHDHLALPNAKLFARYKEILASRLGVTPFDFGRVIVSPAFEPEYSISIYKGTAVQQPAYRVTYMATTESIWALTNGGNDLNDIERVRVRRADSEIPESTATILKQVWMRMLKQAHGQTPPAGEWGRIPMDSTSIEWYLQSPNRRAESAELNNYYPIGPNTRAFVNLTTENLVRYCKADPKQRNAIARTIEADARKLLVALGPH